MATKLIIDAVSDCSIFDHLIARSDQAVVYFDLLLMSGRSIVYDWVMFASVVKRVARNVAQQAQ